MLDNEQNIEKLKCKLALRSDFNIRDCFNLFENNNKEYITKQDFLFGCQRISLNPTNEEIDIIFKKYDLTGDGVFNYNNFFDMFIPFNREYRKMIENRLPNNYIPKYNKEEIFLDGTKLYLQNLLRYMINSEKKLDLLRKELPIIKQIIINKISYKLIGNNKNYITPQELGNYLKNNQKIIAISEADLLFIRFDKDRDGKITVDDILREL
jgi:Ca2+-binding EF-hand superfamily protein